MATPSLKTTRTYTLTDDSNNTLQIEMNYNKLWNILRIEINSLTYNDKKTELQANNFTTIDLTVACNNSSNCCCVNRFKNLHKAE